MTGATVRLPLGYSSEVSYCTALSDTVADVAHDEEKMKENGIGRERERKGKLGLYLWATLNCGEAGAKLTKQSKLPMSYIRLPKSYRRPKLLPTFTAAVRVLLALSFL
jgi:hypothetical protein